MNPKDFIKSIMMFIITTFVSPILIIIFSKSTSISYKKRKLPPSPRRLPIIGNLHQLAGKLPHRALKDLAGKHGDLMFLQLGSVPTLIVSSPDAAREIFKHHDLAFSNRPSTSSVKKITYNNQTISQAPYGDYWREIRKILVLELTTMKRVRSFAEARAREVALMIDAVARSCDDNNTTVDLSSLAFSMSIRFVCHVALGFKSGVDEEKSRNFQELLRVIQRLAGEADVGDYFPCLGWVNKINGRDRVLERSFRDMDTFFDVVIKEHADRCKRFEPEEAAGHDDENIDEHEDIVDVLLRIQKDPDQIIALTNEQLKGVLTDIFVAGTDTSSATIVWTMAELMRNPKIRRKAQHEVRRLTANNNLQQAGSLIEEKDLSNLTYLKQVVKESFRLHPPAPLLVPRETTTKCTVILNEHEEYEIPEKTRVIFNASAIQSDERYYQDPDKFCPERYGDGSNEIDFRGQNFELLPFGSGRRSCPGINFALPVIELALANLLYCFDWGTVSTLDMEEAMGITMHKKTPLVLRASRFINY